LEISVPQNRRIFLLQQLCFGASWEKDIKKQLLTEKLTKNFIP